MTAVSTTAEQPWVDGLTMGRMLDLTIGKFPDGDAVVFPKLQLRWTWREFGEQVERAARGLLAIGIRPGQHVAIWATNVPQWIVMQFATAKIGAVLVTINPAYRPFELKYVLAQSDAVALFLVDQFRSSDYFAMLNEVCPELAGSTPGDLQCEQFPKLRTIVAIKGQPPAGCLAWDEMLTRASQVPSSAITAIEATLSCHDGINIQYTSGTTGFPKAALLSHRNLLCNAFYVGECQRLTSADRLCIPVPFYHCFGCSMGTLGCAVHGTTMVIPGEYFQPEDTLDAIEQERATSVYGVPTMFIAQLASPSLPQRNLKSLRTGIMAGSPCPLETMRQVVDRLGIREITIAYGQTESSPVITQTRTNDPLEVRCETVGRPLPGVEVQLVDPNSGEVVGDQTIGEICVRGHVVMLGYYNNPEATDTAIDREGWLHTGDLATRLPSGCYHIAGRMKDMVIRGGENIYPREIEEFLFTHPAVEQAAVVGVPDPKYVEELCAWVKLKADASVTVDELRAFCRHSLAHYKTPRYIQFVEGFPQTISGKIQKFKIREQAILDLGLSENETA
ncbi:MAG TPA: AMP-binding protein [Pirellulaceae bacterium]|nr:AMP-binding protein [Pirellulaceae bacterium]